MDCLSSAASAMSIDSCGSMEDVAELRPCVDPGAVLATALKTLQTSNAAKRLDLDWQAQNEVCACACGDVQESCLPCLMHQPCEGRQSNPEALASCAGPFSAGRMMSLDCRSAFAAQLSLQLSQHLKTPSPASLLAVAPTTHPLLVCRL